MRDHRLFADARTRRALVLVVFASMLLTARVSRAWSLRPTTVSASSLMTQPGKITDPKVAATRLYEAWHKKSRVAALKVADRETVDKLFGVRWRAMRAKGCERRDEGGFQCIYYDAKNDLSLAINVSGGASAGYGVESVSFSSEE